MKPEPPPENLSVPETGDAEDDFEAIGKQVGLDIEAPEENTGNPYDNSADGFHGRTLPENTEGGGTFLTELKDGVGTKRTTEDEDLGIYEDTDVNGDEDVSDTELELDKLREEKRKRELEEKDKQRAEEKLRQQAKELEEKRQAELSRNVRSLTDSAIKQIEKQMITPRTDISIDSRISLKSWSDPRFLQGISIRDVHWKTEGEIVPVTSMKTEILQSR